MERRRGGDPDRDGLQPKPAPGPLALVQSFVNTRNVMRGYDLLEDIGGAAGWLAERGLLHGGVLRRIQEPFRELVHDGRVRLAGQDARLSPPEGVSRKFQGRSQSDGRLPALESGHASRYRNALS